MATAQASPCSGMPTAAPPRPCSKATSLAPPISASSAGIPPTMTAAASASWRWMPTGIPFWAPMHRPSRCTSHRRPRTIPARPCRWWHMIRCARLMPASSKAMIRPASRHSSPSTRSPQKKARTPPRSTSSAKAGSRKPCRQAAPSVPKILARCTGIPAPTMGAASPSRRTTPNSMRLRVAHRVPSPCMNRRCLRSGTPSACSSRRPTQPMTDRAPSTAA